MDLFSTKSRKIDDEKRRIETARQQKIKARIATREDEYLLQQNDIFKAEAAERAARAQRREDSAFNDRVTTAIANRKLSLPEIISDSSQKHVHAFVIHQQPGQPERKPASRPYDGYRSKQVGQTIEYRDNKTNQVAFIDRGKSVGIAHPLVDSHVKAGLQHLLATSSGNIRAKGSPEFLQKAALAAHELGCHDRMRGISADVMSAAKQKTSQNPRQQEPTGAAREATNQKTDGAKTRMAIDSEASRKRDAASVNLRTELAISICLTSAHERLAAQLQALQKYHHQNEMISREAAAASENPKTRAAYLASADRAEAAKQQVAQARHEWKSRGMPTDPAIAHRIREEAGFEAVENARLNRADLAHQEQKTSPQRAATAIQDDYRATAPTHENDNEI